MYEYYLKPITFLRLKIPRMNEVFFDQSMLFHCQFHEDIILKGRIRACDAWIFVN
jgi:hypothetical protein